MTTPSKKPTLTTDQLNTIIEEYDTDREFILSTAFHDGGTDCLFPPRLHRAALNQMCDGEATVSRYGIWANTVRDHIIEAERAMCAGNESEARRLLRAAANSLSAFSEIQGSVDVMGIGRGE